MCLFLSEKYLDSKCTSKKVKKKVKNWDFAFRLKKDLDFGPTTKIGAGFPRQRNPSKNKVGILIPVTHSHGFKDLPNNCVHKDLQ